MELSLHLNRKMILMFIASCGFVCPRNTTTTVYNYKAPSGCSIRAQCDNWLLCKSNLLDFYVPQQADSITKSIIFLFLFFFLLLYSLQFILLFSSSGTKFCGLSNGLANSKLHHSGSLMCCEGLLSSLATTLPKDSWLCCVPTELLSNLVKSLSQTSEDEY